MIAINKEKLTKKLGKTIDSQEISLNITAPETAPADGRVSGRTQKLATQVTPEFKRLLKQLSVDHNCLMVEIIERAVKEFAKKYSNK